MKNIRKNNKGFSLVELIIVIAIIAVLAAVLAPQYLKYVEKSRVAVDKDTAAAIEQAVNVMAADEQFEGGEVITWMTNDGDITITTSDTEDTDTEDTDTEEELAILEDLLGWEDQKVTSNAAKKDGNVIINVTILEDGTPSITLDEIGADYSTWGEKTSG